MSLSRVIKKYKIQHDIFIPEMKNVDGYSEETTKSRENQIEELETMLKSVGAA